MWINRFGAEESVMSDESEIVEAGLKSDRRNSIGAGHGHHPKDSRPRSGGGWPYPPGSREGHAIWIANQIIEACKRNGGE